MHQMRPPLKILRNRILRDWNAKRRECSKRSRSICAIALTGWTDATPGEHTLVSRVTDLEPALYRYLPVEHALVLERRIERMAAELGAATLGQQFVATAPVIFAWTVLPRRMEWRYDLAAHRVILMDVGHLCQNLYLACAAIGAGTCAIAAYHQELMDRLLGVDGRDEFTIYLAPVGKI